MNKFSKKEKIMLVEQYLNQDAGLWLFSKNKGLSFSTLRDWVRIYQAFGKEGFEQGLNRHYPEKLKIQAVQEYLSGGTSQEKICKKYKINSPCLFRSWILKYNNYETLESYAGGKRQSMAEGRKTTFEERVEIVKDYIESGLTYEEAAKKYDVSYPQVYRWVHKYRQNGVDGLVDRRGKRKEPELMSEADILRAELKLEKAKNKRLELENLVLKKLKEIERRRY